MGLEPLCRWIHLSVHRIILLMFIIGFGIYLPMDSSISATKKDPHLIKGRVSFCGTLLRQWTELLVFDLGQTVGDDAINHRVEGQTAVCP